MVLEGAQVLEAGANSCQCLGRPGRGFLAHLMGCCLKGTLGGLTAPTLPGLPSLLACVAAACMSQSAARRERRERRERLAEVPSMPALKQILITRPKQGLASLAANLRMRRAQAQDPRS